MPLSVIVALPVDKIEPAKEFVEEETVDDVEENREWVEPSRVIAGSGLEQPEHDVTCRAEVFGDNLEKMALPGI